MFFNIHFSLEKITTTKLKQNKFLLTNNKTTKIKTINKYQSKVIQSLVKLRLALNSSERNTEYKQACQKHRMYAALS